MDANVIDRFDKNSEEEVLGILSKFEGKIYADVRIWRTNDKGKKIPTKKGIKIEASLLPEFKKMATELNQAFDAVMVCPESQHF